MKVNLLSRSGERPCQMNVPFQPQPKARIQNGFTLIELLVSISILAILMAILLPSLLSTKSKARTVQCQSTLRQWGLGLRMYLDDNASKYPFLSVDVLSQGKVTFNDLLRPYLLGRSRSNTFAQFQCPEKMTTRELDELFWWSREYRRFWGTYGYNAGDFTRPRQNYGLAGQMEFHATGPVHVAIKEMMVTSPSRMISLGDTVDSDILVHRIDDVSYSPSERHRGGSNMGFCDSHVEWAKREQWVSNAESVRQLWQYDNQPH